MKVTLLFVAFVLYQSFCQAQSGTSTLLTWMKGDNTIEQPGVYGTRGVPDVNNKPGARDFSATWKDGQGNFWLFGGYGYDADNNFGYLNDLWKFTPATRQWTWVKGDDLADKTPVFGQQGTANTGNKPGGISGAIAWTDNEGNFWLFGGFGFSGSDPGLLNDLWKYSPTNNTWTWVKGDGQIDAPATYGVKGNAHNNNKPGARYGGQTWTDSNNNLWLFGGYGLDNSNSGILNDLWKFNITTNKWTWVKGDNTVDKAGIYGQQSAPAAANNPGSRYVGVSWKDNDDNLWLFGGYGFDKNADQSQLNDLWKYNIATNQWTWIKGDNTINRPGAYGSMTVADANNKPGARYLATAWTDENAFWLFGGYGMSKSSEGYLNDIWKFDPATSKWTWMKGDSSINQAGVYGTQGMLTVTTKSGARTSSVSWMDGDGNPWIFGGYGYNEDASGMLNDLWKVSSLSILPVHLTYFNGTLRDDAGWLQWESSEETSFSHFELERSLDGIHFTGIAIIKGAGKNYNYTDYDIRHEAGDKVFYRLRMVNIDSSHTYSRIVRLDRKKVNVSFVAFPNPAQDMLNVTFDQPASGRVLVQVVNISGQVVRTQQQSAAAGRNNISMDLRGLPASTYILAVSQASQRLEQKFVKL